MKLFWLALAGAYIGAAVVVFGDSYWWRIERCERHEDERRVAGCQSVAGVDALFSSVFWPLYLSIRLQEERA